MVDEQLEFRLTQYFDGTLPLEEAPALFDELARNGEALAVLDEYRKLDVLMSAQPVGIKWDALAEHISGHIDEEQQSRMRIGFFAAPLRIAVAAMVLLVVGVGTWLGVRGRGNPVGPTDETRIAKINDVTGPLVEAATGVAVAEIEIGPSASFVESDDENWFAESRRPQGALLFSGVTNERQDDRPY